MILEPFWYFGLTFQAVQCSLTAGQNTLWDNKCITNNISLYGVTLMGWSVDYWMWHFHVSKSDLLLAFKVVLSNSSSGFLQIGCFFTHFQSSTCTGSFSEECLSLFFKQFNIYKQKKAPNSRDEPVLCLHVTDNLAKNHFPSNRWRHKGVAQRWLFWI